MAKKSKKHTTTEYYLPDEAVAHARKLSQVRRKGQTPEEDIGHMEELMASWRKRLPLSDEDKFIINMTELAAGEGLDVSDLMRGVRSRVVSVDYNFGDNLSDKQIIKLLPVMNKYIFGENQTLSSVRRWLDCKAPQPIIVKNATLLCLMLQELRGNDMICYNWQDVAGTNKTFASNRGKILTAQGLANRCSKVSPLEISNLKFEVDNCSASKKSLNQYNRYKEIMDAVATL